MRGIAEHRIILQVHKSPVTDREKLLVRINAIDKPEDILWWDYINLKVMANGKKIVCKLSGDDIQEVKSKKPGLLHINEPLRSRLRLEIGDTVDFTMSKASSWYKCIYFAIYHPEDAVRVGTILGIVAVAISIVSFLISIITLIK
jgi:hypothetical protein